MFVMFGPVVLTGLIYIFDLISKTEFAVKIGLTDDPRTRLTKFYQKYNPTKMRDVSAVHICVHIRGAPPTDISHSK